MIETLELLSQERENNMLIKDAIKAVNVAKSQLDYVMFKLEQLDHRNEYLIDKGLLVDVYIKGIHEGME
jgi:hypothetical protein